MSEGNIDEHTLVSRQPITHEPLLFLQVYDTRQYKCVNLAPGALL